jgi:hypothetical protein
MEVSLVTKIFQTGGYEFTQAKGDGSGRKRFQKDDRDRSLHYKEWRRGIKRCCVSDIDHVEWRYWMDVPYPVAILELTTYDGDEPDPTYMENIIKRWSEEFKGKSMIQLSKRLQINCYIVLFSREEITDFYVYNYTQQKGWKRMDKKEYSRWIESLDVTKELLRAYDD